MVVRSDLRSLVEFRRRITFTCPKRLSFMRYLFGVNRSSSKGRRRRVRRKKSPPLRTVRSRGLTLAVEASRSTTSWKNRMKSPFFQHPTSRCEKPSCFSFLFVFLLFGIKRQNTEEATIFVLAFTNIFCHFANNTYVYV